MAIVDKEEPIITTTTPTTTTMPSSKTFEPKKKIHKKYEIIDLHQAHEIRKNIVSAIIISMLNIFYNSQKKRKKTEQKQIE